MCIDEQNKTQNLEPPRTQKPEQSEKPKKEKKPKESLGGTPKIKYKPYKRPPQNHTTTPTTNRVVQSITVSF